MYIPSQATHFLLIFRFDANCSLVKPRWVDFHKQVVDVGFLGRWTSLRKAMFEFDVNQDEWDKDGNPTKVKRKQELSSAESNHPS